MGMDDRNNIAILSVQRQFNSIQLLFIFKPKLVVYIPMTPQDVEFQLEVKTI